MSSAMMLVFVVIVTLLACCEAFRLTPLARGIARSSSKAFAMAVSGKKDKVPIEDKPVLSRSDVVILLQGKTQFHKDDISKVLSSLTEVIREEVFEARKEIRMKDFGTFKARTRASREGRNPKTGDTIKVSSKKSLAFTPSGSFKTNA